MILDTALLRRIDSVAVSDSVILGITDFEWTRNLKSGILEWGGLRLRSRDLTKIGQLVVNGGNWNGRRIVSQKWVKESMAAHIGPAHLTYFYGYQWWLG